MTNTTRSTVVVQIGQKFFVREISRTFLDGRLVVTGIAAVLECATREEAERAAGACS